MLGLGTARAICSSRAEGEALMCGQTYRLKTPTLSILNHDGHTIPVTIPMGGTVKVAEQDIRGNPLVAVDWEGKQVMMFKTDLRKRGELVSVTGT